MKKETWSENEEWLNKEDEYNAKILGRKKQ